MKIKFKVCFVLAVVVLLSFTLCSCWGMPKEKEFGFFRYRVMRFSHDNSDETCIEITGLTELGSHEKALIVPKTIEGIKVKYLRNTSAYYMRGEWYSDVLEKVFVYENYYIYSATFLHCKKLSSICVINFQMEDFVRWGGAIGLEHYKTCFINPKIYFNQEYEIRSCNPANAVFYYNYDDAENYGVCWLDNVEYGERIEVVPPTPEREGYEFGGWFKEPECFNGWDFNTDRLPEAQLDGEGNEIYQETKIFAKWI